ncbi:N4-gp56 family major capsid protein [Pseudomonas typographi]|uniref:N4-gp56 family major capsid protein n=1 Tax=Pseudomonas typographi TaxID=2715964 RepID=UPI0016835283|nr:N4-gp56 family major capsid protein [Pseudomonas typographi]MBD1554774.1 N4-gp56 family major capsid protein [Pseudomonas typographi]
MALTNFAALQPHQKLYWSKKTWTAARDDMFLNRFLGDGTSAVIQHITELTQDDKGTRVIMNLVGDLAGDGVTGDNWREGNEEALEASYEEIQVDLISNAVRDKGKLSRQQSVINFRRVARDRLVVWMSDRVDQLAILTLSGVAYKFNTDGSTRSGSAFPDLAFAADVSAPSSKRYLTWDGSNLVAGSTATVTTDSVPKYKMIVDAIAYAKSHKIRPVTSGGKEYFVLLVQPGTLAALKMDPLWQNGLTNAGVRGDNNPWFTGATITVDGAIIHESNKVYTTLGAAAGSKWGADGNINGTRTLLLGAQALGFADIDQGGAGWVEKLFNYDTQMGVSLDRFIGFKKPRFYSATDKSVQDFGVLAIDHYLPNAGA